jgi:preprotein translocase subunit Sec63
MEQGLPESPVTFERALVLFDLTEADLHAADSQNRVDKKRRQLLLTWHPHRYANLTNNPKKYMKMYKQGEAMTKDIEAAYELLVGRLEKKES